MLLHSVSISIYSNARLYSRVEDKISKGDTKMGQSGDMIIRDPRISKFLDLPLSFIHKLIFLQINFIEYTSLLWSNRKYWDSQIIDVGPK